MALEVALGSPVDVPAGVEEHGLAADVESGEGRRIDRTTRSARRADHDTRKVGQGLEREPREVATIRVAVKRAVEVRAGVRDHVDPPDVELGAGGEVAPGLLAGPVVADDRRGQSPVR